MILQEKFNKILNGGRKYIPLSKNAQTFWGKIKASKSFWRNLEIKNTCFKCKRQGRALTKMAVACTREMAINHIDELALELIDTGIFKNAEKFPSGKWTGSVDTQRVFNHEEILQFINYGVDGHANEIVSFGKGDKCERLHKENRVCNSRTFC